MTPNTEPTATEQHRQGPPGGEAAAAEPRWGGAALLRPGVLAFTGSIGSTDAHAHHAVQIVTATTELTVLGEHGARYVGTKVVVPADAPHRIEVGAREGTVIFLEPESGAGTGRALPCRALRVDRHPGADLHPATSADRGGRRADRASGARQRRR